MVTSSLVLITVLMHRQALEVVLCFFCARDMLRWLVLLVFLCTIATARHKLTHAVAHHSSLEGHHHREHPSSHWLVGLLPKADPVALVETLQKQLTNGVLELTRILDDHHIVVIDTDAHVSHDELAAIMLSEKQRPAAVLEWFHRDGASPRRHH